MSKFDRKKFRENLKQQKQEKDYEIELETEERSPAEKLLLKFVHFLKENRLRVFLGFLLILIIISAVVAVGEYNKYKENLAILEAEKLEKKIEKALPFDDTAKIKEMEEFLKNHSARSAQIRISKQLMDIHIKAGEYQKAFPIAEKIATSIESPKEVKAYFYYLLGNYSEQSGDKKISLEAYKKAYEQISGKKEMVVMSSWTLFQIGRLKYEQGDKEGSIVDLKKVLELDSDQMGFALKQPKLMSTYLLLKINKG
jgi:tetratricopeptide (TPR) repeat protein